MNNRDSILVVLLVLAVPLMLFLQDVFHSSSRETNILFSFIITNYFNNCYTAFPWLPWIVTEYRFTLKMISGERDGNISS